MLQPLTDIQLILWDIDGTLLWPKGSGRASTKLAMIEVFQTDGGIDSHHFGGKTDWQTLLDLLISEGISPEDIRSGLPAFEAALARHLESIIGDYPVEPCPAAHNVVTILRDHEFLVQGLVTGNVSSTVPIKLRAAGFDPSWFMVGAFGNESPNRNDLPFLALERAIQRFDRHIRPEQVAVVGDTVADIACARALGAVSVAVKTGYATDPDELASAQPDYLLDDLSTFLDRVIGLGP
ncbi:MAG: HAD hydrolase-like protein [Anaerolineae bacterium]